MQPANWAWRTEHCRPISAHSTAAKYRVVRAVVFFFQIIEEKTERGEPQNERGVRYATLTSSLIHLATSARLDNSGAIFCAFRECEVGTERTSIGVDGIGRKPELRAHDQPLMCALALEKTWIFSQADGWRSHPNLPPHFRE